MPDVPSDVLQPRQTWNNVEEYDQKAKELAQLFITNFEKFKDISVDIKKAGPQLPS